MYDEKKRYGPELVIIGENTAIPGLEREIKGMSVNQSKKLELEPKDAFGERSAEMVRVMPLTEFRKRDMDPYPGMRIDLDGVPATVKSVTGGRVMVDANHPLAGEKLICEVKVVAKADSDSDKITALAESQNLMPDSVTMEGSTVKMVFGAKIEKGADYFIHKDSLVGSVMKHLPKVTKVLVNEEYIRKEESKAKEKPAENKE